MRPSPPPAVREITRRLEQAGHETWAVGGAVRDVLMGRPAGDWDLATRARPNELRKIFRRTVPLGIEHGTVGVLAPDGTMYEVTTFRRDVETDGRHAVVAFADTIEEDLARRDFTVNAIAWHPLREELLDPFGGAADMEAQILRTVGDPAERFREDYLRILRALRFAGLFDLEIHPETWRSIQTLVGDTRSLSAERIRDELLKVLDVDPAPARALALYAESGVLRVLYAELDAVRSVPHDADRWTLTVGAVSALPCGRPMLRLAALLRGLAPRDIAAMLMRLRFSNALVDETARRAAASPLPPAVEDDQVFRKWLSATGPERLSAVARLDLARAKAERAMGFGDQVADVIASWRRARRVLAAKPPLDVAALALDGRGLIQLGLRPGPAFGRILDELLEWVLDDPSRNRPEILSERALELADDHDG